MTDDEWDAAWKSLTDWLRQRYAVDWIVGGQRHLHVDGDYADPERSLLITIEVSGVLTTGFLGYVQQWLRVQTRMWRVFIPTDNTDANMVVVYPETICVNPEAESNLAAFLEGIRPRLEALIQQGRREFGLPTRPHPPLPPE